MNTTPTLPAFRFVAPPLQPSPEQPGTLCQQWLAIADWLSQPDAERRDPESWERARRRQIPHTTGVSVMAVQAPDHAEQIDGIRRRLGGMVVDLETLAGRIGEGE